jgi:hypothetical protein
MLPRLLSSLFIVNLIDLSIAEEAKARSSKCTDLLVGQYRCEHPNIDELTQEPQGCKRYNYTINGEQKFIDAAPIDCCAAPRIICDGGVYNETLDAYTFQRNTSCRWTNGKYYRTTLALSLFLGMDL